MVVHNLGKSKVYLFQVCMDSTNSNIAGNIAGSFIL